MQRLTNHNEPVQSANERLRSSNTMKTIWAIVSFLQIINIMILSFSKGKRVIDEIEMHMNSNQFNNWNHTRFKPRLPPDDRTIFDSKIVLTDNKINFRHRDFITLYDLNNSLERQLGRLLHVVYCSNKYEKNSQYIGVD